MLILLPLQDFDGGEVGQFVSRAMVASGGAPTTLTWSAVPTDLFPNGAPDLQNAVIQEKAWAIIAGASCHIRFIFDDGVYAPVISQPKCDGNVESCCRRCRWDLYCQPQRQRVYCRGSERECTVRCRFVQSDSDLFIIVISAALLFIRTYAVFSWVSRLYLREHFPIDCHAT